MARRNTGGWWTKERQQRAYSVLREKAGLTDAGARGLVSRWANVESREGPTAKNKKSGAFGISQGLGTRKPSSSDFEDQLDHVVAELNGTEKRAGDMLRQAQTFEEGAVGASAFERAEGFDKRTKRDNFVDETMAGMPHIAADTGYSLASYNPNAEAVAPEGLGAYALGDPTANAGPAGRAYSDLVAPQAVQTSAVGGLGATDLGIAAGGSNISYSNQNAQRNQPLNPDVESRLSRAVEGYFGPGYRADVVSGKGVMTDKYGNPTQKGNHNHPLGTAGDFDVVDPSGRRVDSATMKDFGAYAAANGGFTGIGGPSAGYMGDGRMHLDTNHPGLATWGGADLAGIQAAKERGFGFPGPGAPVPTSRPEQETAIAANDYAPGLQPAAYTREAPAAAPMSPGAAVAMGLGGLRANPAEISAGDVAAARANAPTDGSPYSGPGSTFTPADIGNVKSQQLGLGVAPGGPKMTGSAIAPDFSPDIAGLMSREFTGSPMGLGAFAPQSTTEDRVTGGLRIGGLQPIGATQTVPGMDVTPPGAAMMAPDMMGTGSLTPAGAPMPNARQMQPTIAAPNAVPTGQTIADPSLNTYPGAPAAPTRMSQIAQTARVGLQQLQQGLSQGLGSGPAAMGGPNYGSGLGAMQAAMGGPAGAMAQSRSNPGYGFQKTATGGIRYGPKGWQALDEAGEQSGGLHAYDGGMGLGGFLGGLFDGVGGLGAGKSSGNGKGGKSKGKGDGVDHDRGKGLGAGLW